MRPLIRISLLAALLGSTALAQTGVIEGIVVDSGTGIGIPGVEVYFGVGYQATTDASGSFRITNLDQGEYLSHFVKDGYVPYYAGSDPLAKPIQAGYGQDITGLRIQLTPLATLRGRVLDPDGNPVANAEVSLGAMGMVTTDNDGKFLFPRVVPGTYTLRATTPGKEGELPQRIRISSGEAASYDIRMRAYSAYRVRGKVIDTGGKPVAKITVGVASAPVAVQPNAALTQVFAVSTTGAGQPFGLFQHSSVGYFIVGRPSRSIGGMLEATVTTGDEGTFEFSSIHAGATQFSLWRSPPVFGPNSAATVSAGSSLNDGWIPATETTAAVDHDVDDLEIRLPDAVAPFTVSGVAELQGSREMPGKWRASVALALENSGAIFNERVKPDGTVRIENVISGDYRIIPTPVLADGGYLSAVLLGDTDVTGQRVHLAPGAPSIRVMYKVNGGSVRGKVENGGIASIVLIPQSSFSAEVTDYGWLYYTDPDGTFALTGLRPGTYYAWALDVSPTKLPDIDVIRALVSSSTTVQIEEGGTATTELKSTRVPQ